MVNADYNYLFADSFIFLGHSSVACGLILNALMFTVIAIYKCPVILFKWWKRLIKDLIMGEVLFQSGMYSCPKSDMHMMVRGTMAKSYYG